MLKLKLYSMNPLNTGNQPWIVNSVAKQFVEMCCLLTTIKEYCASNIKGITVSIYIQQSCYGGRLR